MAEAEAFDWGDWFEKDRRSVRAARERADRCRSFAVDR